MGKYVINRVDLGKRIVGYKVYVSESKEFIGLTEKQVRDTLSKGEQVYGFILGAEDNLQLDKEGFHTNNIMVETGIDRLRPLETSGAAVNVFYVVVAVHKGKDGTTYEMVSSRYGRTTITENKLKSLMEVGCISGGVYTDGKGKLAAADGVEVIEE